MGRACWHPFSARLTRRAPWTLNLWHPIYLLQIVFTTLEGDRIQIRFCNQKPVFINDRKHPECSQTPTHPGESRCHLWAWPAAAWADPLQKGIQVYFGYFTQEMHIKQIKFEHRLKFKHILKSFLVQGLNQGLRATHHITFNWATVFPYVFPWGDQWLAYEFK